MESAYEAFLNGQTTLAELKEAYPDLFLQAQKDLVRLAAGSVMVEVSRAVAGARAHRDRIERSGRNPAVLVVSFPKLVRARILVLLLRNHSLRARTGQEGRIRFDRFNGTVLQKLLFDGPGFVRKPVSEFWFGLWWPFLSQRAFLMPLVNKKGIYCFYSRSFIDRMVRLLGTRPTLEIAAGDGTLARFLRDAGADIRATDDRSWSAFVDYPEDVEALDAREALRRYSPRAVVCSWAPPDNGFEAAVFTCPSVELYIVVGAPGCGNLAVYTAQSTFDEVRDPVLTRGILPQEEAPEVRVFHRRAPVV